MKHPFFFIARHGVYNYRLIYARICMSARIDYDIFMSGSIALIISILSGGHPHPMPRPIIEKSLLHATRRLLQPFTGYAPQ